MTPTEINATVEVGSVLTLGALAFVCTWVAATVVFDLLRDP